MGWENVLGYMFASLYVQHKIAKGEIFMAALQKDKSNSSCHVLHGFLLSPSPHVGHLHSLQLEQFPDSPAS